MIVSLSLVLSLYVDPGRVINLEVIDQDITSIVLKWSPNASIPLEFSRDFIYEINIYSHSGLVQVCVHVMGELLGLTELTFCTIYFMLSSSSCHNYYHLLCNLLIFSIWNQNARLRILCCNYSDVFCFIFNLKSL